MTTARALVFASVALVGCGDDGPPITPPDGPVGPQLFSPKPGQVSDWDMQLVAPFDVSATRQLYVLDLWDVATAGVIDYGGGQTVTVPAGSLAGKVAELQGKGAKVVCHIDAGAIRLTDPDAMRFPGFEASPPDRPTVPTAGSVIGWSVHGDPNTRYLDLRAAGRALWETTMFKRIALAKTLGCDAIDAAWIDQEDPGFPLVTTGSDNDITSYYSDVASEIHANVVAAVWHASTFIGKSLADGFTQSYEFALVERCAEFDECDLTRGFAIADRAVLGLDYDIEGTTDRDGDGMPDGTTFMAGCQRTSLPDDWIHKKAAASFRPTSTYRMAKSQCP